MATETGSKRLRTRGNVVGDRKKSLERARESSMYRRDNAGTIAQMEQKMREKMHKMAARARVSLQ